MDLFEYETEDTMTREAAAALLRKVADDIERHNSITVARDGLKFVLPVPAQVTVELEVEIDDGENEIEISISW